MRVPGPDTVWLRASHLNLSELQLPHLCKWWYNHRSLGLSQKTAMESAYHKGVITLNYSFILRRLNQPPWHQQDSSPWKKPQPEYLTADRGSASNYRYLSHLDQVNSTSWKGVPWNLRSLRLIPSENRPVQSRQIPILREQADTRPEHWLNSLSCVSSLPFRRRPWRVPIL